MTLTKDRGLADPRISSLIDHGLTMKLSPSDGAVHVDDQNDFGSQGGSLYVEGAEETREAALQFLMRFPEKHRWTTGCDHPADDCSFLGFGGTWPAHCVRGTKGNELVPRLYGIKVSKHIKKGGAGTIPSYGAVHDEQGNSNGLSESLHEEGIKRVFVYRLAFDFCVGETAEQLAIAGFEVYIVADLTHMIGVTLQRGDDAGKNSIDVMLERVKKAGVKFCYSSQLES